ncbi:NAD(P)/FAD-dependent oxidoreductase [Xanthobacteraceae bacterium Astr-EGSB]|uniref:NAD(P)/FAD-dependent oxidoreductase n=1 Tax=Astrobacterium formosum TaxID=3069710 RepID=UPI0027AE5C4A|nr:NAD(P)/FAD-dependent oxidoreductase [Xanthobacteraceae bacterium Astr-EGSB]
MQSDKPLNIAIIGTGISGLSAAWLLSQRHAVTVYEQAERVGGHSNTVTVPDAAGAIPVDTGFIVYNEATYPNLVALFDHLGVATKPSDMSFAVSLDDGRLEYSGSGLAGLLAQPQNLLRPRFWSMLADIVRFYRLASRDAAAGTTAPDLSLRDYLDGGGFGHAFREDHLLPMAGAIWSSSPTRMEAFPAAAFLRFHHNHGLLKLRDRPQWRTVAGGSRAYVERLTAPFANRIRRDTAVCAIRRSHDGVHVTDSGGHTTRYDHVVVATHADQALALLSDPSIAETSLLGSIPYSRNLAVLHSDTDFMPRRRSAWASWNYLGHGDRTPDQVCVTYWMNLLQGIDGRPLFVTLNPPRPPRAGTLIRSEVYEHPLFDAAALSAQARLWSLQGQRHTWFCGAYFGAGFHEDGLQAGLAVAEQLGGLSRPWMVAEPSGRINVSALLPNTVLETVA